MKTVIYLCNTYIATIEELQKTIEDNYLGKAGKPFRKELVALLMDGILEEWLIEHDCEEKASHLLRLKETNETSDSELFKKVYRILLGKKCTVDLDSAFSQIAVLLRCEIDGNSVEINNNRITAKAFETKELKFVFKTLEEIDSKMVFELVNANAKQMPLNAESSSNWYAKDSEFSVTFDLGEQNDVGVMVLQYKSGKENVVCEINLFANTREIVFDKEQRLTLYYIENFTLYYSENKENTRKAGFWVLEPNAHTKLHIYPNWYDNEVVKSEYILKKLNDLAKPNYKFRFARENEIKTLITNQRLGNYPSGKDVYYPMEDGKFTWLFDGMTKKVDPLDSTFVAVLDENNSTI
ncbi:MAG: hypothetical protein K6G25_02500 [Bacteroidales bacterium]|nr:hypothetical protein [Bacteroidales bacterium]